MKKLSLAHNEIKAMMPIFIVELLRYVNLPAICDYNILNVDFLTECIVFIYAWQAATIS